MRRFQNWAGTVSARPTAVVEPESEPELAEWMARTSEPVKVVGSGHSWSAIACPDGAMLALTHLDRFLHLDREAGIATVEAGIPLHRLVEELASRGFALPILGSVTEQTIAGAISTGTHGSSLVHGNLASTVRRLRLVDATGQVHDLDPESTPGPFRAARVGLGALGVITRVDLAVVPLFTLREEVWVTSFSELVGGILEWARDWPYLKAWWLPHTDRAAIYGARPTEQPERPQPWSRRLDGVINNSVFPALLWLTRHSDRLAPSLNKIVASAYFRPRERTDRWDRILTVAMPPVHRETEYAIPVEQTPAALRATDSLIRDRRLNVNFPVEVRFVKGDDAWLSPASERDSCQLGAYQAASPSLQPYFDGFGAQMLALDGRPHWGKEFDVPRSLLRERYPHFDDFVALARTLDPQGRFRNPLLDRILGESNP